MKTTLRQKISNLETAATQTRIDTVPLRDQKLKPIHTMKTLIAKILLVLLAAASPLLLPAQTLESFTFTTNRLVPDGSFAGLSDVRTVSSAIGNISSLKVRLKVAGEFNGDLYAYLRHTNGFVVLLNRVGRTTNVNDAFGYGDSGFDVTFAAGAVNGDVHVYQNVSTPADGSPLTGIWQPDGRNVDPTNVTQLSARNTALTNFNGLTGAGEWTLYLADVESGGTNMLTQWGLDISGAAVPSLTWTNPAGIVYGTALSGTQLNASAKYNGTNVPGTFTYSAPAGTVLNAGAGQSLAVTFTPADTNSFLAVSTNVLISVAQAPLTITAGDTNKIYGAALPAFSAAYTGFMNGDGTNNLTSQVVLATGATAASGVGAYPITAGGASGSNYVITHVNGTLTIITAPLTVTASGKTKLYGAALPIFSATYTGFVNGDDTNNLITQVSLATSATAASPVGAYTITASGTAGTNYTISHVNGTLTITPAPLTVTASGKTKVYGAALPIFSATYTGFVNGDDTNNLVTQVTLATSATAASPVGAYTIIASGTAGTNYTISHVNGTLTVTPAGITVTADDKSKAFGAALPVLTASYSGFVLSETTNDLTALATLVTTATPTSNVGTYPITASGAGSTNYTFSYVPGVLTVTQSLTTGSVVSSANPALPGAEVVFTMTVAPVAPGAGTPSGSVNFRIDGSIAGAGSLAGGVAVYTNNSLALGSHTVVAEYAGDGNFIGTTNALATNQVINTPPVAGNDSVARNPLTSVKVRLSTLLANDSDADSDPLAISVSSTSASNATITVRGGFVFYTPPAGFTNADSFTYTITDGRGGSATGTVTVTILVDNAPSQNLTITPVGVGSYRIDGSGIPGYVYRLQFSDSATPFNWQDIMGASVTADSTGRFNYTDTSEATTRFFRSVYP